MEKEVYLIALVSSLEPPEDAGAPAAFPVSAALAQQEGVGASNSQMRISAQGLKLCSSLWDL